VTAAEQTWRLLPFHLGATDYHVALSDALVRHIRQPTIWWHATEHPTLLLGAGQGVANVDLAAAQLKGVRVVKRHAGGTAVYAGPEVLGLDVALPRGHPLAGEDVVEAYRWLGEVWVDATRGFGAPARLVTVQEARGQAAPQRYGDILRLACFGTLSPYEVTVEERKLVGLAQVRRREGVLLQSGIHLRFDATGLASLLTRRDVSGVGDALDDCAVGLHEATGIAPSRAEVMAAFHRSLRRMVGVVLRPGEWSPEEQAHALQVASISSV
jgi:lipoate-protein ligase A